MPTGVTDHYIQGRDALRFGRFILRLGLRKMISQLGESAAADEPSLWFALRIRSKHERVASEHLRHRGYEEFSPTYRAETQWSDRKKMADRFLFPGYVFCRLDPNHRLPVLTIPGVVGIVGFGQGASPIPDSEIERIRMMTGSGLLVTPWPYLEVGQMVVLERGPLAGLEGILEEVKGEARLVVSIELLQRSVSTEIDRTWVRPLKRPPSSDDTSLKSRHSSGRATKEQAHRGL
jgi:transcriptional antiterminator NusG